MTGGESIRIDDVWADASDSDSRERQFALWRMLIRSRYLALVAAFVIALTPAGGNHQYLVAALTLIVVVPYNAAYDVILHRTRRLPSTIAYTDQLVCIALLAVDPPLAPSLLLVLLAVDATSAVAFGRGVSAQSSLIGAIGVGVVLAITTPPNTLEAYLVYLPSAAFIVLIVGGVSEIERGVRTQFTELVSGIDAIVWEQITRGPTTLYVSRRAEELLGYRQDQWSKPGFWSEIVHPDDREWAARSYRDAVKQGENRELEYRLIAVDGRVVHMHDHLRVEGDSNGRARTVRGVMIDVTDRKRAEEHAEQYVNLVEHMQLALLVFRLNDLEDEGSLTLVAINPEASEITGTNPIDAIGQSFPNVMRFPDAHEMMETVAHVVRTQDGWSVDELRLGEMIYSLRAFPLPGQSVGLSIQDVTERSVAADVLRHQALHDGLTGLPNRTLLNDRLRNALADSEDSAEPVALVIMDLDQFKEVNDALGHDHGDKLLVELSRRLRRVLRNIDTLARLGGDEFAVLLTADADEKGALLVAEQISTALERPFRLGGISIQTSASIGVALYPQHASDAETLNQRADVAMYTAKRGDGGIALYSAEHDQSSVRRLTLLGELRNAIQDDQLRLHYQPVVDLQTGMVPGVEALVRWEHPDYGLMPPADFIGLAEVSGSIQALSRWVISHAISQMWAWAASGLDLTVAVNLSVRNLYDPDLVRWLADLMEERSIKRGQLQFEITESQLMDDPITAMEVIGQIRALGVRASIDDFGTGYSSLAYLKHLPIDELKIDRSFVGNMVHDESDLAIVRSTIDLSHNLGLSVVAEGVEDHETLEALALLGCDRAQGYHISRPMPASDLSGWLAERM